MDEQSTPQEGMNPELEVVEETIAEETIETPEEVLEETVPKSQFNQVLARAKKAEGLLKQQPPKQVINNAPDDQKVQVTILKALGKTDEEIDFLKTLAAVKNVSILDAQSEKMYLSFQKEREDDAKAQKAKLGASRSSGSVKKEKEITSQGLTDQEHKELWKAQTGR